MGVFHFSVADDATTAALNGAADVYHKMEASFVSALSAGNIDAAHYSAVMAMMVVCDMQAIMTGAKPGEVYANMKAQYESIMSRKDDVKATYDPIEVKGFEFKGFNNPN